MSRPTARSTAILRRTSRATRRARPSSTAAAPSCAPSTAAGRGSPAADLAAVLAAEVERFPHTVRRAAVSVSQASERGAVYAPDELGALSEVAHGHGMALHMDGARFANAVAHLGCTPAATTWRAGVDVLSLGFTKNGALAAEAVVLFAAAGVGIDVRGARVGGASAAAICSRRCALPPPSSRR